MEADRRQSKVARGEILNGAEPEDIVTAAVVCLAAVGAAGALPEYVRAEAKMEVAGVDLKPLSSASSDLLFLSSICHDLPALSRWESWTSAIPLKVAE